jgi:hypothetical protein
VRFEEPELEEAPGVEADEAVSGGGAGSAA